MHTKLAGHVSLQEMIAQTIDGTRTKLASIQPSVKTEATKVAHADTSTGEDEVTKLASALIELGEKLASDTIEMGGEKASTHGVLPTKAATTGTQGQGTAHSKAHAVPVSQTLTKQKDAPVANTIPNDHNKVPGGSPYPKKGVLKTASESVLGKIKAASKIPPAFAANAKKVEEAQDEKKPGAEKPDLGEKGKDEDKEKKSSALDFLLGKVAQEGDTVLTRGEDKAPPPSEGSNSARKLIASNAAVTSAKRVDTKAPQKKQLAEVLTEPALTSSTDNVAQKALQNASKGGVKIAAAKALLQKIAEGGCQCEGKGECKYCKLKAATEAKKS